MNITKALSNLTNFINLNSELAMKVYIIEIMLDSDVPLLSEDISLEVSAMLNASLVCNKENMDDDKFVDDIEMDNIEELSTSLELCTRILCKVHC
ncbi:hypothetical protein WN51_06582 [Melipona quadrifasciata]|uniref:Uncharacterized protein n=1 Tax=Melipona quadrifasciata TaxID=166423 RepID=A0A0N0BD16_9HYME|nr:hypothetical protein WN51_06582 [Melipona quadrifasciata]